MLNKKAQLGETMTWVVATIVIIVTLVVFVYVSSLLKNVRNINLPDLKMDSDSDANWIEEKVLFSHSLDGGKNKEKIDNWIKGAKDG